MIILRRTAYQQIVQHSLAAAPNEACGLLGGRLEGEDKRVDKVYLLTNLDHSPEHFSMDPKDQFRAIKDMRTNGLVMLGNFHSHPASPSRPSEEDKRLAFDPEVSYLILSLQDPVTLKSFTIQKGVISEEKMRMVEEEE